MPNCLADARNLTATIWANDTEKGRFYSVDFTRSYKDQGDNWQDTPKGFSGTDLLRIQRLAGKAYDRISELREADRQNAQDAEAA